MAYVIAAYAIAIGAIGFYVLQLTRERRTLLHLLGSAKEQKSSLTSGEHGSISR